jgi:hypothetical protein
MIMFTTILVSFLLSPVSFEISSTRSAFVMVIHPTRFK